MWNDWLAFRGEKVNFRFPDGSVRSLTVTGVQFDGRLILETPQGETLHVVAGEIELAGRDNGS
jgi:biotin-(acetyl-CoA carboxylase) ligase